MGDLEPREETWCEERPRYACSEVIGNSIKYDI